MIETEVPGRSIEKGEALIVEGHYEEAVSLFRDLVEEHPTEDSFLFHLAWAYHDGGRLPDAMACFEQLLERELRRDIFTGFAYDELVRIYKAEGLYERLVSVCEKAVAVQPEDTGYLGDLVEALIKVGAVDKAIQTCLRMIEIDPAEADFYCRLGNALILRGDLPGGEDAYKKAAEMDHLASGSIYYKLAQSYNQAEHYEMAEAAQRKCLAFCPDQPLYHLSLSDLMVRQRKFSDARAACEQAIELNPDHGSVYYNRLGNTLLRSGFQEQAVVIFLKAIALEPDNPFYCLHLAECYKVLGLNTEAEKYLRLSEACQKNIISAPSSFAPL
jgi:protein O-GlcNAc transferase